MTARKFKSQPKKKESKFASIKKVLFGNRGKNIQSKNKKGSPTVGKTSDNGSHVAFVQDPQAKSLRKTKSQSAAKKSSTQSRVSRHVATGLNADSVCREVACEGLATTAGYCRLHYIKNWKKIKRKEMILREGKLNQYIEELVSKYPDKYIEAIRQDLANDKDFSKVIYDLHLDENLDDLDVEGESAETLINTIKRDFEGESEEGL